MRVSTATLNEFVRCGPNRPNPIVGGYLLWVAWDDMDAHVSSERLAGAIEEMGQLIFKSVRSDKFYSVAFVHDHTENDVWWWGRVPARWDEPADIDCTEVVFKEVVVQRWMPVTA